jgi:hypothetical protein
LKQWNDKVAGRASGRNRRLPTGDVLLPLVVEVACGDVP